MFKRMKTNLFVAAVVLLTMPFVSQAQDLDLNDSEIRAALSSHSGACTTHAVFMYTACGSDVNDGYFVRLADCSYIVERDEQRNCRDETRWLRREEKKECRDVFRARLRVCDVVGEERYTPDIDPADFVDPEDIGDSVDENPYWPLSAGHTHVILGDGEVTVVTATDEVRDVGGLPCRVIRDLVFEEEDDGGEISYEAAEVTQDWYAQHLNGDIYYCGENTYEIEDGLIDNTDGSFGHLADNALAGVLLRQFPVVGEGDRQEMASDEAEDYVQYLDLATGPSEEEGGEIENYPCAGGCLKTFEENPREPGAAEYKYYLPGTGFVLASKIEDGEPTGEREEVACVGDSLDVLDDPQCEIADPDALREALCLWSPEALCAE